MTIEPRSATPHTPEAFGAMLEHVAGQAFAAAGYMLQPNPMHHMRGLFRYHKPLTEGITAYVEFQMLAYADGSSRFRVMLMRSAGADARTPGADPARVEKSLSRLIWEDFGVRQYDAPEHWWSFRTPEALGHAIAEAGRLIFGFGIPWLEGTLTPDPA
jgi:hypothetical protein